MKNNSIGKIAVATSGRKKTLKNKSSDLHTTMDFGSVICGKLQRVIPGSTINVGTKERVLLTSLVAPCFGRMSLKAYHQFVPFSDLTQNYAPMMAQEAVYRNGVSFVPTHVPNIPLNQLSLIVLMGAQLTVYNYGTQRLELDQVALSASWDEPLANLSVPEQAIINDLGIAKGYSDYGLSGAYKIPLMQLLSGDPTDNVTVFLSNPTFPSFFDYVTDHPNDTEGFGKTWVSPEGADYLVPVTIPASGTNPARHYLLAFRLSSFGRRLRKNLIGCGWEFNLESDDPFSLLPLLAFYKAYFDVFGLTLYQNWEETYAYKVLSQCDNMSNVDFSLWKTTSGVLADIRRFLVTEFGSTFFTDEQDFVSAQITRTAVSPSPANFLSSIVTDVDPGSPYRPNIVATTIRPDENASFPSSLNGHAYVNDVYHGNLDSELLKKLYRQTNVNTVAGRRIAELLRAQGLGAYVDECKSNFIGSWSLDLNVYDLPSQSDTYQNAHDGMRLGEFGAFGKSSGEHPMVRYETSEDGYFITLLVVVPKGGYAETVDPDALCIDKWSQYNPEYDSVGYQFFKKLTSTQGSQPWGNMALNDGSLSASHGLGPRYFDKKFGRNVINGDFSLRSTRHSYQPFCLERLIEVGEHKVGPVDTTSILGVTYYPVETVEYLNPARLPIAGNVWRYPTRYEWISRFGRIFYNDSSSVDAYQSFGVSFGSTSAYEYFHIRDDNFICHIIFEMNVYDQMLPVQDSFETSDDENHADASMSKA